jgi:hypothetical protein
LELANDGAHALSIAATKVKPTLCIL